MKKQIATCVLCGCTDDKACAGGCSWVEVCYQTGRGHCSACVSIETITIEARRSSGEFVARYGKTTAGSKIRPERAVRQLLTKVFGERVVGWFESGPEYKALVKK